MIPRARPRPWPRSRRGTAVLAAVVAALVATIALVATPGVAAERTARILMGEPATLDPAAAGDAGSSAVIAQLFEAHGAIDPTQVSARPSPGFGDLRATAASRSLHAARRLSSPAGPP
jgi:hypothetical protein